MAGDCSVYSTDYFSLMDILATQERVPFNVKVDLHKLGFLDPSSTHHNDPTTLIAKTSLELPFWMVWALRGKGRIDVDFPKVWKDSQRQILTADPKVLDLHRLGPDFYEAGRHLMRLLVGRSEGEEIGNILLDVFTKRFRDIMDSSMNGEICDTLGNTETLDNIERILFHHGQSSMRKQMVWSIRRTERLETSVMVQRHRKRKADEMT